MSEENKLILMGLFAGASLASFVFHSLLLDRLLAKHPGLWARLGATTKWSVNVGSVFLRFLRSLYSGELFAQNDKLLAILAIGRIVTELSSLMLLGLAMWFLPWS
jgi:hypothetical protein